MPGSMDDHGGWDELSDEEREFMKGKVRQIAEGAAMEADNKSRGWGSIPAEGRKTIREMISKEIPWQTVLKQFCGTTRRANRSSNVKRLNRKYPGIHPGVQKGYTSSIAIYIDQSGSVGDDELELLFGELGYGRGDGLPVGTGHALAVPTSRRAPSMPTRALASSTVFSS